MNQRKVIILGAAGRDFHDFNTFFRDNENYEVVAFTHTSSQNIGEVGNQDGRKYPTELAGDLYPEGIPIIPESDMEKKIREEDVDEVVFSYSDVSHEKVMHTASRALSCDASFRLIGPGEIMLESKRPVVAVDAVRTGCGKSQVSGRIARILKEWGKRVVVVREPMPYGDLKKQAVQRFEDLDDLERERVTIEEREEYEQHIENGNIVYAGVDYERILEEVEKEADIILWEGGNNEFPFFEPDLHFVVTDAMRPGHETKYHPGEANLRMADYVIINKENSARSEADVEEIVKNAESLNPEADIIHANSVVEVENPSSVQGKEVLVVEDGPTLTHGGASFGAGYIAAKKYGASKIIDPRTFASGSMKEIFERYENLGNVLPAMGYSKKQIKDLENSIKKCECDTVLIGTPFDLSRIIDTGKTTERARYRVEASGEIEEALRRNLKKQG